MNKFCPLTKDWCNPACALIINHGEERACSIFMIAKQLDWLSNDVSNVIGTLDKIIENDKDEKL